MRKVLLLACAPLVLAAQTERFISVDGEAEVQVAPDHVVIAMGVETQGKTADSALAQNSEIIKRVLDLARRGGVADQDLRTDFIQFHVQHAQAGSLAIEYYTARKSLVFTLRDLGRFENLLTTALLAGVTHLHGVDFRTSQLRAHRDQARELAVKAAAEKARDMAQAVGRRVNPRPIEIHSVRSDTRSWYGSGWDHSWAGRASQMSQNISVAADTSSTPTVLEGAVAFGRISVLAQVSAKFQLE